MKKEARSEDGDKAPEMAAKKVPPFEPAKLVCTHDVRQNVCVLHSLF